MSSHPTCSVGDLSPGDIMYEVTYYVVESVEDDHVNVKTPHGVKISITDTLVEETIYTTSQFAKEVKVTRTQLAQKIEGLGHAAFRVTFQKQVTGNDIADGLADRDLGSQAKRRKVIKNLMDGETRVMHCKLYRTSDFDAAMELGRYKVIDLEHFAKTQNESGSIRMVDTRTVSELIVDNVKYYIQ